MDKDNQAMADMTRLGELIEGIEVAVLRIKVRDAMYWDAAGNFAVRSLNFAKAMASGDPHDLGDTGKLSGAG